MTERGGRGRSWEAVKRDAIAAGLTSNERIEEAGEQAKRELRAYRLAEIRKRSAATQRELAARMHVTQGRVSQIESGQWSRPSSAPCAAMSRRSAGACAWSPTLVTSR